VVAHGGGDLVIRWAAPGVPSTMNARRLCRVTSAGLLLVVTSATGCFSTPALGDLDADATGDDAAGSTLVSGADEEGDGAVDDGQGPASTSGGSASGDDGTDGGSSDGSDPADGDDGDDTTAAGTGTTSGDAEGTSTGESPVDTSRLVFLLLHAGAPMDYGGTDGADAECQSAAEAAGLPGVYMAWLSATPMAEVATRFSHDGGPFVRPDGEVIAEDWADLTDGSLAAPIDITADGSGIGAGINLDAVVVTHTHPDGTHAGGITPCAQYTSDSLVGPRVGDAEATDASWTEILESWSCTNGNVGGPSLYCFQQ
jgi:hypothetical protein